MARKKVFELKPGLKFRGIDRCLWHVVGSVCDGNELLWVCKSWALYKGYWVYEVKSSIVMNWILDHQKELSETKLRK